MNSPPERKRALLFIVEKDDDLYPLLRRELTRQGYRVIFARDAENALTISKALKGTADLILVNQAGMSIDDALSVSNKIRLHAELEKTTPLIIIAQEDSAEMDGQDIAVGEHEYISYLRDIDQLYALLHRLLPSPEERQ